MQVLRLRLLSAAGVLILFVVWAATSLAAGSFFVPAPWTTIADTAVLLTRSETWTQILITFLRVCIGFVAGFLAGVAAGIAIGTRRDIAALLKPFILFFQGMPPLLWTIPLVALMGIGHIPTIIVITLITLPLVAVTISEGMTSLPRELGEMLDVFAPGFSARTRELIIPHLTPFFAAAVNAGLVLAVKASVTAEYFGANNGIGFQIQAAYMSLRIRSLFAWAAVLVLLILLFSFLLPRMRRTRRHAQSLARRHLPKIHGKSEVVQLRRLFISRTSGQMGARRVILHDVGFSYPRQPNLLAHVNLTVRPGEIAIVTGESGIGKTSLLKLVASLLRPSSGKIITPPRVGFVFQDDRLLPWRSVAENIAVPLVYQGPSRENAFHVAYSLLEEAGLSGEEDKRPEELSGGMKKRVALARCFARLPDLILMDEPFSGLHARARSLLWEMFLRLHRLHPVPALLVTHYPEEIVSRATCRLFKLEGKPAMLVETRKTT
jgi:ABC-type nitrate/sulfonate/bicarbonate transport system ATPase subunit/ABC-type nitrate/sulfonate/bicarbonate transport system permease component